MNLSPLIRCGDEIRILACPKAHVFEMDVRGLPAARVLGRRLATTARAIPKTGMIHQAALTTQALVKAPHNSGPSAPPNRLPTNTTRVEIPFGGRWDENRSRLHTENEPRAKGP